MKTNTYTYYDNELDQNVTIDLDWDCPICGDRMEIKKDCCCQSCWNSRSQDGNYAGYGY